MSTSKNNAWEQVNLAASIADLKDDHYHSLLALSAMLELLIDKGLLSREEVAAKAAVLDQELTSTISASLRPIR
ncbi:hypothetical protein ACFOQM_10190 [Paenibacillus sp. GCM10012307]|uniref:Nitrile hydratase subunit beta n=1 Tax=Paenibacillus roseus TaxID=2798579 RepID=A0A934J514_9BACL|nr:hypothetical protein [Paenibacillus roseus]MBJ6361653.1 hypothetical protein [Paenibacillus roseus]